jgi:hypothetical protein
MGWGNKPCPEPKGRECGCCITIEADFVFVICNEVELWESLQELMKVKENKELENQE